MCRLQICLCKLWSLLHSQNHIYTPVNEHLSRDRNSHIFKPLGFSKNCDDGKIIVMSLVSKFIIDNATSFYQIKIKESIHIEQLKPELNKQVDHVGLVLNFLFRLIMSVKFLYNIIG